MLRLLALLYDIYDVRLSKNGSKIAMSIIGPVFVKLVRLSIVKSAITYHAGCLMQIHLPWGHSARDINAQLPIRQGSTTINLISNYIFFNKSRCVTSFKI